MIPVARLRPPAYSLRGGRGDVRDLVVSIRKFGLLHPILVRPVRRGYEIVCGERRVAACRELHMGEIPAFVREMDERMALQIRLAENSRRAGISPKDRARILDRLQKLYPTRPLEELERWVGAPEQMEEASAEPPPEIEADKTILIPPEEPETRTDEEVTMPPAFRETSILGIRTEPVEERGTAVTRPTPIIPIPPAAKLEPPEEEVTVPPDSRESVMLDAGAVEAAKEETDVPPRPLPPELPDFGAGEDDMQEEMLMPPDAGEDSVVLDLEALHRALQEPEEEERTLVVSPKKEEDVVAPPADVQSTMIGLEPVQEVAEEPKEEIVSMPPDKRSTLIGLEAMQELVDAAKEEEEEVVAPPETPHTTIIGLQPITELVEATEKAVVQGLVDAGTGKGREEEPPAPGPEAEPKPEYKPSRPASYPKQLMARIRMLLSGVAQRNHLDVRLLELCVDEILSEKETREPTEFLDLSYHESEARYVPRHSYNVAKLCLFAARAQKMEESEVMILLHASLLHDAGLLLIPPRILKKKTEFTPDEREQVEGHPSEAARLLSGYSTLRKRVASIVREHHERPNGNGYPNGLERGETDPLSRFLHVADSYEAMVSPRVYKLPLLPFGAMKILRDGSEAGDFDVEAVESFAKALSHYPVGSFVKLGCGHIGQVVGANAEHPDKPNIRLIADPDMNVLKDEPVLDLSVAAPLDFEAIAEP